MEELVLGICEDKGLSLDKDMIQLLRMPVIRGKRNGVVGNGLLTSAIWNDFQDLCENGKGDDMTSNWRTHITLDALKQAKKSHRYYKCPVCAVKEREWYL